MNKLSNPMNYIPVNKLHLHLKLKRRLAQFIGLDRYFESKTFDWVALEQDGDQIRATLIRSLDEGDEIFTDVLSFATVNQLDEAENQAVLGSLEECLAEIENRWGGDRNKFIKPEALNEIYADFVRAGKLGI